MDAREAAERWVAVWLDAWPRADVEAISALYAEDAVFSSSPFRGEQAPRAFVAWAFGQQESAVCRVGEPVVQGDRAVADWWAVVTATDGSAETLAGVSYLRFGADGRVVEQRDVWASAPGARELPAWARSARDG